jgi:hypothetical protein
MRIAKLALLARSREARHSSVGTICSERDHGCHAKYLRKINMRIYCLNSSAAVCTIDAALVMEFTKNRPPVKAGLMTPTEEIW